MQKPKTLGKWASLGGGAVLAVLIAARGVAALITGSYVGTARYSGSFTLAGPQAYLTGGAYVFLGLSVLMGVAFELGLPKKSAIAMGVFFMGAAAACFGLSLFWPHL